MQAENRHTRSFSRFVIDSPYARILLFARLAEETRTGTPGAGHAPSWPWHSAWWGMLPREGISQVEQALAMRENVTYSPANSHVFPEPFLCLILY